MRRQRRILVVRTDRVGDVVLATPLIRALRNTFPDAYIGTLVRSYTRDILLGNPHLDVVLTDDAEGDNRKWGGFWRQVGVLRKHRFDTALLLLPTERLAWMLLAAGIPRRISVGVKLYEVLTLTRMVSRHKYVPLRHEADYCLDLGRAIGVRSDDLSTELFITAEERGRGRAILREAGIAFTAGLAPPRIVLIHPGSGRSAPNWKVEDYVAFAGLTVEDRETWVVVTGSLNERVITDRFTALDSQRVINLAGKLTLRELMAVIANSSLVVSASTGPMHIAAGLGVPTLSIFCRLTACSPGLWGPRGNASEIVLPPEAYCTFQCPGDPKTCTFEGGISPSDVRERMVTIFGTDGPSRDAERRAGPAP